MGIPKLGYWGMPLGCRFHPTDQELVSYLRLRAVAGEPLDIPFTSSISSAAHNPGWCGKNSGEIPSSIKISSCFTSCNIRRRTTNALSKLEALGRQPPSCELKPWMEIRLGKNGISVIRIKGARMMVNGC
ncbi:hypothetical protein COP2_035028 [Malus domestica]